MTILLCYKIPKNPDAFRIPGGNYGIWVVGSVGIIAWIIAISLGFIPPR